MRKIFLILFIVCAGTAISQPAQTLYTPYQPAGIPADAPAWMAMLSDVEHINFRAMEDSFERFMVENPQYRYKTPATKGVINYFRRWQRAYRPYVQRDGSIKMPSHSQYRQYVADMNAASTRKGASLQTAPLSSSRWEVISPLMTYNWRSRQPYAGQANIQCFDISRSHPHTLYAGAETGMIFRTQDRGQHWTSCTPDFYFGGIPSTIEISHTNPQKVVMGAGAFLWLTEDGGATWREITPSQHRHNGPAIRDVIISPTDDTHMIMGNRKGIYKTTDNGQTWQELLPCDCFDLQQKFTKGKILGNEIYALARENSASNSDVILRYSPDGGETWQIRSPKLDYKLTCGRIGLSEAETGDDYIYLVGCKYDRLTLGYKWPQFFGSPQFFKSTDAGQSWEDLGLSSLPSMEFNEGTGQGYYCMFCSVSSEDPETVFLGMLNFYKSTDGGKSFENLGGYTGKYENIHFDQQEMRVLGGEAWIAHDGGLNYSTDFFATSPEVRINGIYASEFHGYSQGWNEDVVAGGRYHNGDMAEIIGRYPGAVHTGGGETFTGYVMLSDPHKVAFSDSQNFILPDDLSQEVKTFHSFLYFPYESPDGGCMEFDPRYAKSYLINKGWGSERNVLWKTIDDGRSFVQLYVFNNQICNQAISRSNPDKIVVTTTKGLYYSMDGGDSFAKYENTPDELWQSSFIRVEIHPRDENEIWLSATDIPGCVYRTRNNGETWEKMDKGLTISPEYSALYQSANEQTHIKRFVITGNDKNAVYAMACVARPNGWDDGEICDRGRVLYIDDTMDAWQDFSEGLPQVISLKRMLPFFKDGKLRVATNNGIWQRDLIDKDFRPIAQPMILNTGTATGIGTQVQLDSYSIVNQKDATWQWSFKPQPLSVSDPTARNPIITVDPEKCYHVTLTVTTPAGSDTKTVPYMIVGTRGLVDPDGDITATAAHEVLKHDFTLSTSPTQQGALLRLTPHGISADCHFQLFSMAGKCIDERMLSAEHPTDISTQALLPGTYFYIISSPIFKKTGKILIR